jgi:hypothetical protein
MFCRGLMRRDDAEEDGGVAGSGAVEAEKELVEIGPVMLLPVAYRPGLEEDTAQGRRAWATTPVTGDPVGVRRSAIARPSSLLAVAPATTARLCRCGHFPEKRSPASMSRETGPSGKESAALLELGVRVRV